MGIVWGIVLTLIIIVWLMHKYRACPKCGNRGTMKSSEGYTWCNYCYEVEKAESNRMSDIAEKERLERVARDYKHCPYCYELMPKYQRACKVCHQRVDIED